MTSWPSGVNREVDPSQASAASLPSPSSEVAVLTNFVVHYSIMVVVHCAYTEPINVSGTSPTLTREQIWKGLQRKIRRAYDFVPVIDACDVIEDKGDEVIREAHFKDFGGMKPHTVREVCKSYYPCRVSDTILCSPLNKHR